MGKSKKLPIIKERPRNIKNSTLYWRRIRRNLSIDLKSKDIENLDLRLPKEIVNDYNYCDYVFTSESEKYKRK